MTAGEELAAVGSAFELRTLEELEPYLAGGISPHTHAARRQDAAHLLAWLAGAGLELLELGELDCIAFRDWCAERTNYPSEVPEMALAHVVSSEVERAYRRGDLLEKRQRLMSDWARFCLTPKSDAEVVPLHAKR